MDFMVGVVLLSVVLGSLIQFNEFSQNDFKQYAQSTDHSTRVLVDAMASPVLSTSTLAYNFVVRAGYCYQCGGTGTCAAKCDSTKSTISISRRIVPQYDCSLQGYASTGQTVVLEVWKCG